MKINDRPVTLIEIKDSPANFSLDKLRPRVTTKATGATVSFLGSVRETNRGREVTGLEYECYPEMLRKKSREIVESARDKFAETSPMNAGAAFRTGRVEVGQPSTALIVASPHREPAFKTCRFLLEKFKQELPIWKKEHYEDGGTWIENRNGEPK